MSSALQQLCERLLATADELGTQSQRLHEKAVQCRRLAAQAAQATRGLGAGQSAQALEQAGKRCEVAAQQLEAARGAAHRFVQLHVGDSDGGGGGRDGGATASAYGDAAGLDGSPAPSGVLSAAVSTPGGLAFFAPEEPARRFAHRLPPLAGYRTYDLHGTSSTVTAWDGVAERDLSASEFAAVVRADPGWDGGPIRLFSCDTGKGPDAFAQKLADELGVEVLAPNELAWSDSFGQYWAATATVDIYGETCSTRPPDGHFASFRPKPR